MYAADAGHVGIVRTLLARGADADLLDRSDWTALALAMRAEDVETVEVLAPVTSIKLGHSLVILARNQLEITEGIKSFITKCGGEKEVFLDGVREATEFGNIPLLQALLDIEDTNWLSEEELSDLTKLAIMSDSPDMCATILSLCGEHRKNISQRWVHLASERRNVNIQKLLDPVFPDQLELIKEKLEDELKLIKEKLRDDVIEKEAEIFNTVPKSDDFAYNRPMDQVVSLLDANDSVTFAELLKTLHMPEVHYKGGEEGKCPEDCQHKEKCSIIRQTVELVKIIAGKLEEMHPIFMDLKSTVVGSLKENTRTFAVDEVDINMSFPKIIGESLFFNPETQSTEFNNNPTPALLAYKMKDNTLNGQQLFKDFVGSVHKIIEKIELPAHLTMDPLTTSYTPCLSCMKTDMVDPECKRCHHEPTCQAHDESCGCAVYTSPNLTHSKIGIVLHLQWTMADGSKTNLDCDVNCPNLPINTPYDGGILEIQEFLRTEKPVAWLEEYKKLENMYAVSLLPHVTRSVRLRLINRHTVMARQVRVIARENINT